MLRTLTLITAAAIAISALLPAAAVAAPARIVKVVAPTVARENPGFGRVIKRIPTTTPYGHDQLALRVLTSVLGEVDPATGVQRTYYKVHLPYRRTRLDSSNGHTGWVASDHVQLMTAVWTVQIKRSTRKLTLKRNGRAYRSWSVVVGAAGRPTPAGKFAVYGKTTRDHSFDGTGILPFAYSPVHAQFDGANGMLAMHGRSGASLATPLGTAGSNGCVRMANASMQLLLDRLPIGTPVDVI